MSKKSEKIHVANARHTHYFNKYDNVLFVGRLFFSKHIVPFYDGCKGTVFWAFFGWSLSSCTFTFVATYVRFFLYMSFDGSICTLA
jgi:hypothetical protein